MLKFLIRSFLKFDTVDNVGSKERLNILKDMLFVQLKNCHNLIKTEWIFKLNVILIMIWPFNTFCIKFSSSRKFDIFSILSHLSSNFPYLPLDIFSKTLISYNFIETEPIFKRNFVHGLTSKLILHLNFNHLENLIFILEF